MVDDSSDGRGGTGGPDGMDLRFTGEIWRWQGPSPYYFLTVPDEHCARLHAVSPLVTYGWGMIPVRARIAASGWQTSLFPKDGGYILPVKSAVRRAEHLDEGDTVMVQLTVAVPD